MFATLFLNVSTVFLMMLPGYILIRKSIIRIESLKDLSHIIVKMFYPCLIFTSISSNFTIKDVIESWQLPAGVFVILVLGYIVGLLLAGFFKTNDHRLRKSILYQFTMNNYSFLPLAIIAKLFNDQYAAALIFSTLGAELTVWTLGMMILNDKAGGFQLSNLKQLFSPPLMGVYASLVLLTILDVVGVQIQELNERYVLWGYLYKTITQIGLGTIPLAMLMVGGRMAGISLKDLKMADIWIVTFFRLIIIPIISVFVMKLLFPTHPYLDVLLIVSVMPTSVVAIVFGELYDADHRLMSGTVLVSHVLSLITIPLWLMFLNIGS